MAVTSFEIDAKTERPIDQLKSFLNEKTVAGVVRKALALPDESVEAVTDDGCFYIEIPKGERIKIRLV